MAKSDGSVIIATLIDTDGIKKGTVEIEKELLNVGDSADKANDSVGGGLADGFKKLGKAIIAAGVIDAVIDFGKEAIELGSDLEEVQNVVDVTFTTMSKQVNKFAKDAQKSAGLSEKMAKQYVGTFGAMADSFGFTEAEAYEMSTALTQLTGDVASFYNLSQDEAMNKLKGVFTGETEALKELGVVMTQTALDGYALANGFDKTTSSMTEQEKVALRYQFVMDQLSAASGDFVRTQEGWANQSRILSLQWESLMATLGSGMIDILSPGIEFLNNKVLPGLNEFAKKFAEAMEPTPAQELEKSLKNFEDTMDSVNSTLEDTSEEIEFNALRAKLYIERLEELESAGLNTAEAQREYANVVAGLNELFPELNLRINEQTGLLDANSRAQLGNIEAIQQKYFLIALEEQYNGVLTTQGELQAQLYLAEARLIQIENERDAVMQQLSESTGVAKEELINFYRQIEAAGGAMTDANGEVTSLTDSQQELYAKLLNLNLEFENTNDTVNKAKDAMEEQQGEVLELKEAYDAAAKEAGEFEDSQDKVTVSVTETATKLEDLAAEYAAAQESAKASIDSQIGLFDELVVKSDKSAADIVKNWETQRTALENYRANLQKAIEMGLDEALVRQLSDGSAESMAILQEFVSSTDTSVDEINEAFRKTEEAKQITADAMADVQTEMGQKLAAIEGEISTSWSRMNGEVGAQVAQMQATIDSLMGKTVYINVIQRTTKSSAGGDKSLSNPSNRSIDSSSVPYLARGAVIPPNAPFMAVLGDQRHGTNVEAPLSTIQEAVANVIEGAILSGFTAMIKEQKNTQEILKNIEIGDTVIGQAVDRYNEQNNIIRGGLT